MVAGNASGVSGCVVMWAPASNSFYLANDAATVWMGPLQGGSGGTLQNSQCVLTGGNLVGKRLRTRSAASLESP
jgi:hypothetical protein